MYNIYIMCVRVDLDNVTSLYISYSSIENIKFINKILYYIILKYIFSVVVSFPFFKLNKKYKNDVTSSPS